MRNQNLLIIGNGFDLKCELKSKYNDFYLYRKKVVPYYSDLEEFLLRGNDYYQDFSGESLDWDLIKLLNTFKHKENVEMNIWDLIFSIMSLKVDACNLHSINWVDIESMLRGFIISEEVGTTSFSDKLYNRIINRSSAVELNRNNIGENLISEFMHVFFNTGQSNQESFTRSRELYFQVLKSSNRRDYSRLLLSELNRFENELKRYLYIQSESNEHYNLNANNLLKVIVNGELDENAYVLSFNYTFPLISSKVRRWNNIHGFIGVVENDDNNNVVLGFDRNGIEFNEHTFLFTKTYRLMTVKNTLTKLKIPPKKSLSLIQFCGHSLGEADFSYFFSIFDYYDIYNEEVRLEFIYYLYEQNTRSEIEYTLIKNISYLIYKYGLTMQNTEQGKSLQHKLLIEQRLSLRFIE